MPGRRLTHRHPISGSARPHLRQSETPWQSPRLRPAGGPPVPTMDAGWLADAACAGMDPELFFTEEVPGAQDAALAACAGCPVRRACLQRALACGEMYGVFGGLTARQRQALRRNRAPQRRQGARA